MESARPSLNRAWRWRAMGTTWHIHHTGGVTAGLVATVAETVEEDEERWSRFRRTSEVSLLNARAGQPVPVSGETLDILESCLYWTRVTGGAFQPLVGGALCDWGYADSLDAFPPGERPAPAASKPVSGAIRVDRTRGRATIPPGTMLDLGGIGKSWSAVRAAGVLADGTADPSLLLDAGGDIVAVRGEQLVVVDATGERVLVPEGWGVATSGCDRRTWVTADGVPAHHLIDPETGMPGDRAYATVLASDPVAADVLATVLVLRPGLLARREEPCVRIGLDGSRRASATWKEAIR
jgi:FAD:protein FMN transferase